MSLETALIAIGTAVAKGIIKSRMAGNDVADETTDAVLDLLKDDASARFSRRKADNLISAAALEIAKSFEPLIAAEGAGIDEGARVAIAMAVAHTIAAAKLTPDALVEMDLAPRKVLDRLKAASPKSAKLFSEAEATLFARALDEASQQIVDAASRLPLFTERSIAELLRRQTDLMTAVLEVLKAVEAARRTAESNTAFAEFEERYLRAVARNLDILELFGTGVPDKGRRYRLSVAYIGLSVHRTVVAGRRDSAETCESLERGPAGRLTERGPGAGDPLADLIPIERCLAGTRRLLIRGDAGSGKTTLLQWIAVRAARNQFPKELKDWNGAVPFFIRLRDLVADEALPGPDQFPKLVSSAIAEEMPPGWARAQLKAGRAILLVDGVDEVSEERQEQVRKWLSDLDDAYGSNNRFVVSGRTHIPDDWLSQDKFDSAETLPMEMAQIREFINKWHDAIRLGVDDDIFETDRLSNNAAILQRVIAIPGPLRKLARNPLLCALICALNWGRDGYLPADRVQLYRECIQILLERGDRVRGVEPRWLSLTQQTQIIQELAYYMLRNGWTMVSRDDAVGQVQKTLDTIRGVPADFTSDNILKRLIERSGVIRMPTHGRIDFIHRTFQEFLGASAALDVNDLGVLIEHAHDPEWREVIILAVGQAAQHVRDKLIRGLIKRGDDPRHVDFRTRLHLLAAVALEAAVAAGPGITAEVSGRIAQIHPPSDDKEGAALAAAGDLAAPHLLRFLQDELLPARRAIIGRALSLAGDPREGVGLRDDGLPDIAWSEEIPPGEFLFGDGNEERAIRTPYRVSRYPVTYAQYQAFAESEDGYANPNWWQGLHDDALAQQRQGPGEQRFKLDNHPCETVSWYDAMAFCRWLSARLGYQVRLPTEEEWERAARGTDGRTYPWGSEFDATSCNVRASGIAQTSAVGLFPDGASSCGALDMSGNVWEWTLTKYHSHDGTNIGSNVVRILRGCSWFGLVNFARAAYRHDVYPGVRNHDFGFRVASPV